jgi:hypothetical protein
LKGEKIRGMERMKEWKDSRRERRKGRKCERRRNGVWIKGRERMIERKYLLKQMKSRK